MNQQPVMDTRALQEILPHRYPFLMVDRILQLDPRQFVVGLKNITISEPYFQGHFADSPVVPGVLILESLLQTGATLFLQDPEYYGRFAFFAGIDRVVFHENVTPGDQLRLEMDVKSIKDNRIEMQGRALVEGRVVCDGSFSFQLAQRPNKPQIHATASVHHTAVLGRHVVIGPNTIVGEHVHIGDNTVIDANCFFEKWTRIGEKCRFHFGCVVGSEAQDMKYKGEKSWVTIGDNNEVREYVTINRATGENEVTSIGSHNIFLTHAHIAHNCTLHDHIIIANSTNLGGHTVVDDRAVIGGMTGIHQFVRIGQAAMVGAYTRLPQDVPPFMLCEGNPAVIRGLNVVGLRRNGLSKKEIAEIKDCYRLMYRSDNDTASAIEEIKQAGFQSEAARRFLQFVDQPTKRGLTKKTAQPTSSEPA